MRIIVLNESARIDVPLNALLNSIQSLTIDEKLRLWKAFNEQLELIEEEQLEEKPEIKMELKEAKEAYNSGDYITLKKYLQKKTF